MTYDLQGNGKTLAQANYARYFGQVGTGGISGQINPVTARERPLSRGTTPTATSSSRRTR